MNNNWFVYIIEAASGKLYTGITKDIKRRFKEHSGKSRGGAKFFRTSPPARVVFKKRLPSRSRALKVEAQIKHLKREEKLKLCLTRIWA